MPSTHIYDAAAGRWRQMRNIYVYDSFASKWQSVKTAYIYDASVTPPRWRIVFSSGTFFPEIRQTATGGAISYRSVGLILYGYRGSTTVGTYNYVWQYNSTEFADEGSWATQTGTGATGTLVSTTPTATYTTDANDLANIQTSPWIRWMRFKVTKSGETQYSQTIRITKRPPSIRTGTTPSMTGTRFNGGATYDPVLRNPYPGDTLKHISSWTLTTTLTNDTRPDYYIYTWSTPTGIYTQDSRYFDVTPSAPQLANQYVVQNSDLLGQISVTVDAFTSNPTSPFNPGGITTRNVSDGILQAPTNLVLTYTGGKLVGTWFASDGGTDGVTIYYDVYLERNLSYLYTTTVTATTFNYTASADGDYRFYVVARQSGSANKTSDYSNTYTIEAPAAFTYELSNITETDGAPGDFTIFAFTQNATISNQVLIDWSDSTNATNYNSEFDRPNGTTSTNPSPITASNDFWNYFESGNYTSRVIARNTVVQRIRISWTKPANTSAQSYRITYRTRVESIFLTTTVDVGDVTFYDFNYRNDSATAPSVQIVSIIAYSDATAGSGITRTGTPGNVTFLSGTGLQKVGTLIKTRTEFLSYIIAGVGTLTVSGLGEPNEILSYSYTGNWVPAATDPGWSFTRTWGITRNASGLPDSFTRGTNATVIPTTSDIGEVLIIRVVAMWKDQTPTGNTVYGYSNVVVPGPPSYALLDNANATFTVSTVNTPGATHYYGTYTPSGTIPETSISSSYTSPNVGTGSKSVTLYARTKKTQQGFLESFNSRRSTTQSVTVTEIGAFTWSVADATATPARPDPFSLTWDTGTSSPVRYDWNDTSNTSYWDSQISGGPEGLRSNTRSVSNDFWQTTALNTYTATVISQNTSGIARVSWGAAASANSYKINYTQGASTQTTAPIIGTSYDFFLTTGTTITINNVSAFAAIDGTGAFRNGTRSGSASVTPAQKASASRLATGTAPTIPAPATPTGVNWNYNGFTSPSYRWSGGWDSMTNATSYTWEVQYATSSSGTNTNTTSGSTTGTTLTGSSTKSWSRMRVRANGAGGSSAYSAYTAWA